MNVLHGPLRHGAERAWASLSEGWRRLRLRVGGTLTPRRHPVCRSEATAVPGEIEHFRCGLRAADVQLRDDVVVVRIEAPLLHRDDLQVVVGSRRLCVQVRQPSDGADPAAGEARVHDIRSPWRRVVALPHAVDAARASASYRDGVLQIELSRLDSRPDTGQSRRIPVS